MCESEDYEATDEKFVDIVNNEDWTPEPNMRYRIVEWSTFMGIMIGIACVISMALGGVVWVWKQIR